MIAPCITQPAAVSFDEEGFASVERATGWRASCCGAGPRRLARSKRIWRPATYRTVLRARIALAAHLAVAHGVQVEPHHLHLSTLVPCPTCGGIGFHVDDDCDDCDGDGLVPIPMQRTAERLVS